LCVAARVEGTCSRPWEPTTIMKSWPLRCCTHQDHQDASSKQHLCQQPGPGGRGSPGQAMAPHLLLLHPPWQTILWIRGVCGEAFSWRPSAGPHKVLGTIHVVRPQVVACQAALTDCGLAPGTPQQQPLSRWQYRTAAACCHCWDKNFQLCRVTGQLSLCGTPAMSPVA
jgi:hypothetical protein